MATKQTTVPDGFRERPAAWHFDKFCEFIAIKQRVGEPSPHLNIVGYMARNSTMQDRLWLLGCYAATYCLPTAQVIWNLQSLEIQDRKPGAFRGWIKHHWEGIVTRTERRCVRTPEKMFQCLSSYRTWMREEFPTLTQKEDEEAERFYDRVWESVEGIKFFGRYINIRLIEGLRRYCGVPASLYDIRSIGGWSPKKCLCYLYPKHAEQLLIDDAEGNALTNQLAYDLLERVRKRVSNIDCYILAAMLCEYKGAFEKRHQYPSWTLDQEPLLYDKVFNYWGDRVDRELLWESRRALFSPEVLGETSGWHGTRWDCAATLRNHGYNWNDFRYSFSDTTNFSQPVRKN